ncbi:MAG: hypothetical protein EPN48_18280 [Microbacteriaceae bacterium]|nr:MAG: hypothetical protein EPN48_18280 [Microbacteriaceae bacterium]
MSDTEVALGRLQELIDLRLAEQAIAFRKAVRTVMAECAARGVASGGPLIYALSECAVKESDERNRLIANTIIESISRTVFNITEDQILGLFDAAPYDDADLINTISDAFRVSGLQADNVVIEAVRKRFGEKRRSARTELSVFAIDPRRANTQINVHNPNIMQTGGISNVHQHGADGNGDGITLAGNRVELLSRLKSLRKVVANLDDPRAGCKWWIEPAKTFIEKVQQIPIGSVLSGEECDAVHEVVLDLQLGMDQMRIEDELQRDKAAAGWKRDGSLVVMYFSMSDEERTRMRASHFCATLKDIDEALSLLID